MNIFADFHQHVHAAIAALADTGSLPGGLDWSRIAVEPPRDAAHGDMATNAAMVLAKPAGMKPRDLAALLADKLAAIDGVAKVDIAGPGFINITLQTEFWPGLLARLLQSENTYGRNDMGAGLRVNVEYVSANPTGPLHVGHCRGAVFGDALANLLEHSGYDVTREYYINDAGAQIDTLARSSWLRYLEALGEPIGEIPEGLYPGDYLKAVGAALASEHGDGLKQLADSERLERVRQKAVAMMTDQIREDLALLNITHDIFFSERALHESGRIGETIAVMQSKGLIYEGRLPPPKGQLPDDWEDREQTLFKATDYGDDIDRPLMKSDGSYTYFAADVAYARDKIERGFDQLIYVLGADHGGYVKRLQAVAKALSDGKVPLIALLCQLVRLFRAGEPVVMSKRAGDFVTLREVVDEVGPGVVRFMMLTRKNDAPLDFDFVKVTEQSRDNPVFYVQYAHARAHSVLRNAAEELPDARLDAAGLVETDFSVLRDEAETGLIKQLAQYPRIVEAAAQHYEPHRIAFYLYELAAAFHGLWNKGKDLPQLRFINADDPALTLARLGLVRALALVISDGLSILGVDAVEEMR